MSKKPRDPDHVIELCPIIYDQVVEQMGMPDETACHALLNYALKVGAILQDENGPQITGMERQKINYRELMKSVAIIYGVAPEEMVKFWGPVDLVIAMTNLEAIPATGIIRQDGSLII